MEELFFNASFLYWNGRFTHYGSVCVLELKCVQHLVKVMHAHQCPFSVKMTREVHQSIECFWARTPTSSIPKCGWKNSWMETTTTGFVLFGTKQKTKGKHTVYLKFKQIQRNLFYKSKSENKHVVGLQRQGKNRKHLLFLTPSLIYIVKKKTTPEFIII